MSPELQVLLVTILFLGLLTTGMAVPFSIMIPAMVYLLLQGGLPALNGLGQISWGSMNSFTLTAIPIFMLLAEILTISGLSNKVYNGLAKLVFKLPGGLLQTNIVGCMLFGSLSGSSVATAASIGNVALPQLIRRKYHRRLAAGSLAAGGTLGILVPPSLPMIIYGSFTDTSVPKLFMAGIVPGLIMTTMFMVYIGVHAKFDPSVAPKEIGPAFASEYFQAFADVAPFLIIVAITLGGIYFGIVTITEAAVIGCCLAIAFGAILGDLSLRSFMQAIYNTIYIIGNILFLVLAAYIFSVALSFGGLGEKLTQFMISLNLNKFEFYTALFVLFTILGCLVESLGMLVITVPLLYPILKGYGISPIHFGIIVVIFIELGQISPPIGINLFVIQSVWNGKLADVILGTIPFHLIMFVVLAVVIIWPDLALWLPAHMD